MTLTRERVTYFTLVVSEAAWLYAFISVLGVSAGSSGSPLSFFAILGLLGLSTITYSYIRWKEFQAFELFYVGATLFGVVLAYMVMAAAYDPEQTFTIDWIAKLIDSTIKTQGVTFHGVAGGILAIGLWFRGIRLAMNPNPEKSLTTSFRLGLILVGFSAVMGIMRPEHPNVFAMVLIFFGAGLVGLNVGHLVSETSTSAQTRTWPKVIGLAVVGVLVVGGMFGFLQQEFVAWVTSPIRFVFSRVVEGLLLIVSAPIVLVLEGVNSVIAAVFSRPFEIDMAPEATVTPTPTPGPSQDFGPTTGGGPDVKAPWFLVFITQFVRYGLVVATVVVVSIFLYVLARKLAKKLRKGDDESDRESILDEMNFASDIGDLFSDFMSNVRDLFKGAGRKVFRLPEGPPGVVEALRLYYQMLTTAEQNEVPRPEHYTPNEFRRDLRRVFPNELVEPATEAFNRAQYGDIPTESEEITKMRASFRVERAGGAVSHTAGATPVTSGGAIGKRPRFETVTSEITEDPLARQRARFDSPSLTEKSWFSGIMGVLLACGGGILFAIVAAALFAVVVFIGGA
ncbi:MAG: DUF4129 domain-containing protein [Rhodospirillales bacterium]|nr:DUF4129 domain-containing protein [Rhodospirillales bacterium]